MIEPTERTLWLLVAVAVTGVVGLAVPSVGLAAPYALAGLLFFFFFDVLLAGDPGDVSVTRALPERIVEHRAVEVGVTLQSSRRVVVEVTDTLPAADDPWLSVGATLEANERVTLRAQRTFLRRGRHTPGRIAVRTLGPLGLVRRRHRRRIDGEIIVGVDLSAVSSRAARLVRGADSEGARRKCSVERGRELDSLRDYRRGDDVRLVDWKATARRGDLVVKELVPETRQDVVVVVDCGRQMCGRQGRDGRDGAADAHVDRFVVAEQTALVLAAAALKKGDRAGLLALADDVVAFAAPAEGRAQLKRLADALGTTDAVPVEPAYQELPSFLGARLKRRGMVCVVTDVVDEASARALAAGLAGLRGRHVVVVVALADPGLHRLAVDPPAPFDPLGDLVPVAAQQLLAHRKRALAAVEAVGAIVVDAPPARAAALAVDAYLALKAQGRL